MFRSSSDSSSASSHLSFRRALKAPGRPIAVRSEYVKDSKTFLVVRPQGDRQSSRAYKIEDADGVTLFTATGRKFSVRACREFWDASGLPLFELHRKMSLKNTWFVTLPGSKQANIATASGGWSVGDFKITFQNRAAVESKKEEEKLLTLEVEKYGNVLASFDVVDGDRKVAEIRESIPHNERLALLPSSKKGYRPVLDVTVLPGVDLSLIAIITVMASDWVFSSNY